MKAPIRNLDPQRIYAQACAFEYSAMKVAKKEPGDEKIWPLFAIPNLVLIAFAAELFLKCLHCIDSGLTPEGHNLKRLFDGLPRVRQDQLILHWSVLFLDPRTEARWKTMEAAIGTQLNRDLRTVLSDCGDGFRELRYIYERTGTKFYGMESVPRAFHQAIIAIHPDWEVISFPGINPA